jgi:hypothetical protein
MFCCLTLVTVLVSHCLTVSLSHCLSVSLSTVSCLTASGISMSYFLIVSVFHCLTVKQSHKSHVPTSLPSLSHCLAIPLSLCLTVSLSLCLSVSLSCPIICPTVLCSHLLLHKVCAEGKKCIAVYIPPPPGPPKVAKLSQNVHYTCPKLALFAPPRAIKLLEKRLKNRQI